MAVDISWQLPEALGFDLSQLLVGRAHTGQLPVGELPELRRAVIDAYVAGLERAGVTATAAQVAFGCDAALLIRSAFTCLPLELLAEPATAARDRAMTQRLSLTRYLADLGLALRS